MEQPAEKRSSIYPVAIWMLAGILISAAQISLAQPFEASNRQTREFLSELDADQRKSLRAAVMHNMRVAKSGTDLAAIPRYHLYRAAFIDVLTDPDTALEFSVPDWEIIFELPSHSDGRFTSQTRRAMSPVCRSIEDRSTDSAASASQLVDRFVRARQQAEQSLDDHYARVMEQLSPAGRLQVAEHIEGFSHGNSMVYSDFDLGTLAFSHPGFVQAFIKDSCRNLSRNSPLGLDKPRLLRDELSQAMAAGTVQIYSPR